MTGNKTIPGDLIQVRQRLAQACARAGRPENSVTLVAVSKAQPAAAVEAAAALGQVDFGENYLQEALAKRDRIAASGLVWHFIGPVQSNKTREIAGHFDWVHGVERLKIAQRLSDQRPEGLPALQVCVQVNVSAEASKAGVAPAAALDLCRLVAGLPRLRLRGLMAIPAPGDRTAFSRMRGLYEQLQAAGLALDTLSMGMSEDFESAVAEGATLVRVGSAIFGSRGP